jgi:UDP-N-acetylglucosamine acyltransferase
MIHPTALVHQNAVIGDGVHIGPFSIIEDHVTIGDYCKIESHVQIGSYTTLGHHNHIYQGAVIGSDPQDLTFQGEPTYLTIGNHNIIREYVTLSKGTVKGSSVTKIGDHNFLMIYTHLGHDTLVGNHVILTNNCQIAGHVEIEDHVVIGGSSNVHQFCKIGRHAMVGGVSKVVQDVVPYALVSGNISSLHGINAVGLKRAGLLKEDIIAIKNIHHVLFREGLTLQSAIERLKQMPISEYINHTLAFLEKSTRGICRKAE